LIIRVYSYFFQALVAFAAVALAAVSLITGSQLYIDLLHPLTGMSLTYWLLGLGILGFGALALALKGKLKVLFLVWSVGVFVVLTRGYFFSPYQFWGPEHLQSAILYVLLALLAVVGAWMQFRAKPAKGY
jgi:hypothetical protein